MERERLEMLQYARKRLANELRVYNPPEGISFGPVSDDDFFQWYGVLIVGPVQSYLQGTVFHLSIRFPLNYPFSPPRVHFQTQVYHPNVGRDGSVLIDILGDNWSPALNTEKLLLSIYSVLLDPALEGLKTGSVSKTRRSKNSIPNPALKSNKKKGGGWRVWKCWPRIKVCSVPRN